MTISMTFDASSFEKQMMLLARKEMPDAAIKGMTEAAGQLLDDATNETPSIPLDDGTLRGSGSAFAQNKLIQTNPQAGNSRPATSTGERIKPGHFVGLVGFNSDYAAFQHEGVRKDGTHKVRQYSEPGSGAKFVEKKLADNSKVYMAVVAERIKRELG